MSVAMASPLKLSLFTFSAVFLLLVNCVHAQRPVSTCCPFSPFAYCDFYFDGYMHSLPEFHLNDGRVGDHALSPVSSQRFHWLGDMGAFSPSIKEAKKNRLAMIGGTNINATFLRCPATGQNTNAYNQFYVANVWNVGKLFTRTFQTQAPMSTFVDQCILLPVTNAQIPTPEGVPINLNPLDGNTDYPESRRCIVFKTVA